MMPARNRANYPPLTLTGLLLTLVASCSPGPTASVTEAAPVTGEANTPATETPSSKTEIDTSKAETAPSHPKEAS
ncbi:MAG: hypothetical protein AAFZ80_00090, partial [Cyanobacteria bacterium P01_A01_bin.105]